MCSLEARKEEIPVLTREALISLKNSFLGSPPVTNFWPSRVGSWGENLSKIRVLIFLFCLLSFLGPCLFPAPGVFSSFSLSQESAGVSLPEEGGWGRESSPIQRLRGWKYCQHAETVGGTVKIIFYWLLFRHLTQSLQDCFIAGPFLCSQRILLNTEHKHC